MQIETKFHPDIDPKILELSWNYTNDATFVIGQDGSVIAGNSSFSQLLGWDLDELKGEVFPPFILGSNDIDHQILLNELRKGNDLLFVVTKIINKDGKALDLLASYRAINHEVILAVGMYKEFTEQMEHQKKLEESKACYETLVEGMPDAVVVLNKGKIVFGNTAELNLFGIFQMEEAINHSLWEFLHIENKKSFLKKLEDVDNHSHALTEPVVERFVLYNGEVIWAEVTAIPIEYEGESVTQVLFRNVTEKKNYEAQLEYMAFHDPLTELYNRRRFIEIMNQSIDEAKKQHSKIVLMYIDIDHFKEINDTFGHDFGDELLKLFAKRLKVIVRSRDVLCRMGGDEFLVLLKGITHNQDYLEVVERFQQRFQEPYKIKGQKVLVSCSIGISIFPEDGSSSEVLISHADQTMYKKKKNQNLEL